MSITVLTDYLAALHAIRDSGRATTERSFYPALAALFDAVGGTLTPRVSALAEAAAQSGEGHPDFLLQVSGSGDVRAAVEVKGAEADLDAIISSGQVARYLGAYGLCLVTNLREFALTRHGEDDQTSVIMRLSLAGDAASFWFAPARTLGRQHGARFSDFLVSALTWDTPISRPRELAEALARYAREALRRLEQQPVEMLAPLRDALARSLGLHFEGETGQHFFRSSLVQTLFYGLFSAWVACQQRGVSTAFRWKDASDYLGLPLLGELFDEIAKPSQLRELAIRETVEWAEATLNRTIWDSFARTFAEGGAINYFYEPFLEAFDPDLRQQLGVWYTPPQIVRYQVARVDAALREELNIPDGLADPRVVVLDPCCGTGAYLVETLRHIAARVSEQRGEAMVGAMLREAAATRIFGFEIMPAPFVVAHLQIGSLLAGLNAAPSGGARAGVYLTNALTGWIAQSVDTPLSDDFPQLKREAAESLRVKREASILVILGNPPYYGFAGVAVDEERALVNAYRTTRRAPPPQGQGLNDLYVRFFRMAERRIVEGTGRGVVCFISNYSWLDGLSHTGMRERYLDAFDRIWIDCLNGDKYRTGKLTPDGRPDPSVFSTEFNREGIQVGTAIATLVRREQHTGAESIHFRHFWGTTKRADLLAATDDTYRMVTPVAALGLPFAPTALGADYLTWPRLPELFPKSFPGVKTSRDDVVVDIDRDRLIRRMEQYFDPAISHAQMRQIAPGAMADSARFPAEKTRDQLRARGFLPGNVVRYCYRPFDVRWLYWEPETKLLDRNRAEYFPHVFEGNVWLGAVQHNRKDFDPPIVSARLAALHIIERGALMFPLRLKSLDPGVEAVIGASWNLSVPAQNYLEIVNAPRDALFFHTVAVMHAPTYRAENAGALRQDWPRIPLPASREVLEASAALGRELAGLLDPETPVPGVTTGAIRDDLRGIGVLTRVGGGSLAEAEYRVEAGWGYAGRDGVTMPGRGLVRAAGEGYDVHLNARAYWANIPARVWAYTLGGYQVIKKWLSYREYRVLGRALRPDEAAAVTDIARRIAAILALEPSLDASYAAAKADAAAWRGGSRA